MAAEQLRDGVNWTDKSTTKINKKIWSAAIGPTNAELEKKVNEEKNWRKNYGEIVVKIVEEQMKSEGVCMEVVERGLESAWESFCFVRGGEKFGLGEGMEKFGEDGGFTVESVSGGMPVDEEKVFEIPYEGKKLSPQEIIQKSTEWADYGAMEGDCCEALRSVWGEEGGWKEAMKDKVFVLLGATSEMGPMFPILKAGGHVLALARPSEKKWEKLIEQAKQLPGTLSYPVKDGVIGADVLSQTPEIRTMIVSAFPEKQLVVGSYIYLDGEAHVRATMAMDAIIKYTAQARPNTIFSWIVSPALAYPIPKEAYLASVRAREQGEGGRWWHYPLAVMTGWVGGWEKNDREPVKGVSRGGKEEEFYVHDCIVNFQGPNYTLAKSIQNWRALTLHQQGHLVSANHGPPARTVSVTHSSAAATALKGAPNFAPNMVYDGVTVSPILFGLLLADLKRGRYEELGIPYELLSRTAWHGGSWRAAWKYDSMGTAIYVSGLFS